ncbi:MAG TPA: hypothetical protein VI451_09440 [Anaerolineales bacterium]|nr:hypothetical protein [Anaerolineales bacterium]
MTDLDGLWWFLAALLPLLFVQRRLHQETMGVFLLLTRNQGMALILFSLLFFPGVVLHEISHWITAKLLGVRTGKIWLIPERLPDGNLRMGYVEAERVDFVRESLIGFAPLLFGGLFVAYAGLNQLKFHLLWETLMNVELAALPVSFAALYTQSDFWLWFYLTFVVSATMMPSASDRQSWMPLILFVATVFGLALLVGAGPWLAQSLAPGLNNILRAAAVVFGISILVHLVLLLPTLLVRLGLIRLTGLTVVQG